MTTASFETTEFRRTFRQETDDLISKRLIWFVSVWGGINLILIGITFVLLVRGVDVAAILQNGGQKAFFFLTTCVWFGAYLGSLILVLGKRVQVQTIVYITIGLVILDGSVGIGTRVMDMDRGPALLFFLIAHLVACCMFPWTIKQALIPILSIAAASAFSHLVIEGTGLGATVFFTTTLIAFAVPGVFITGVKHSQRVQRATNKFLNQRYGMLRQELAYARQVHEALFPAPHASGDIRYAYRYEPMRQIGGDYLYTRMDNDDTCLSVVIVDVTGHGIPAALTVNRLHGEIDISFAENPDISPGEMLCKLNKYVHLTLAKHSIYATAVCIRVNSTTGKVEYASGGHPPAFIRGIDGSLEDLAPTTFVLGACSEDDFEAGQIEVDFAPGDSLIAYTDGAIEARSLEGKMLHIDGLRRLLCAQTMPGTPNAGQGLWAEKILDEVAAFRCGLPPDDDTLAIEIYRPLVSSEPEPSDHFEDDDVESEAAQGVESVSRDA